MTVSADQAGAATSADHAAPSPVDAVLPPGPTIALALQHLLAAYASLVVTPLILAGAMGLDTQTLTVLISAALVTSGLCTLLQCIGAGPYVGIRLPVIQGTTIAAVPALILIGTTHGLNAMFGATLVAGVAAFLAAGPWSRILVLFPPVVTGTVIAAIGLSLIPVAVMWMSGGAGMGAQSVSSTDFALGLASLLIVVAVMRFGRGIVARSAILVGLVAGTLIALPLGAVSTANLDGAPWFALVTPFAFGRRPSRCRPAWRCCW